MVLGALFGIKFRPVWSQSISSELPRALECLIPSFTDRKILANAATLDFRSTSLPTHSVRGLQAAYSCGILLGSAST